jgi:Domain of unknown function (DUF1905)/Bacteriocin-protection, YdeI or OmpD-Associated
MAALVSKQYQLQKFPGKGGWTYAAIPEINQDKKNPFGWVRVKGMIDNIPISKYHLMPMGNGQLFLPVKAAIRRQLRKKAGDWISVQLYIDNDPVDIPPELLECLQDEPLALKKFLALADSDKAAAIKHIYSVKKEETRAARIAALTGSLLKK